MIVSIVYIGDIQFRDANVDDTNEIVDESRREEREDAKLDTCVGTIIRYLISDDCAFIRSVLSYNDRVNCSLW